MRFVIKLCLIAIVAVIVLWLLFAAFNWSQDNPGACDFLCVSHLIFHLGVVTAILLTVCTVLQFEAGAAMVAIIFGLAFSAFVMYAISLSQTCGEDEAKPCFAEDD